MPKVARFGLMVVLVALFGAATLAGGEHPGLMILVLGGVLLLITRSNAILDRGRLRRGKAVDFTTSFADLAALTRRDWQELGITVLLSLALVVTGVVAFGRGVG